jgi:Second Messenger Oligonucleotide or Dinucleotide Synthetase domain
MTVSQRFETFLANIALTSDQLADAAKKHGGVRSTLNRNYYGFNSDTANSMLVGAWGKGTTVRPPRVIDVLFTLPYSMYHRFEKRLGNKQAQQLQEVKDVLQRTFSTTTMRADGQAAVVSLGSYAVEVVPALLLESQQYWICDTSGGGKYKAMDPTAEILAVQASDTATGGNTRNLIRMMKTWQRVCSVPIKSFILELLVIDFLNSYTEKGHSPSDHDSMVRDFFAFLLTKGPVSYVIVPGTGELIWLNAADWNSRADTAHDRAVKACEYESQNMPDNAGEEWQKIFGDDMPLG